MLAPFLFGPDMRPLIFIENSLCFKAYQYIADNLVNLQKLGYQKLLIELPKNLSLADAKRKYENDLSDNDPDSASYLCAQSYLVLFDAIEKYNIDFEFIDPRKIITAKELKQLSTLFAQNGEKAYYAELQNEANKADETIAMDLNQQAENYSGGIIYLGGYLHQHLVNRLSKENYCFTLFDDSDNSCLKSSNSENAEKWRNMSDDEFRKNFYQAQVHYFDLAKETSFDSVRKAWGIHTEFTGFDFFAPSHEIPAISNSIANSM